MEAILRITVAEGFTAESVGQAFQQEGSELDNASNGKVKLTFTGSEEQCKQAQAIWEEWSEEDERVASYSIEVQ